MDMVKGLGQDRVSETLAFWGSPLPAALTSATLVIDIRETRFRRPSKVKGEVKVGTP